MINIVHFIPGFRFGGIESLFYNLIKNIDKEIFKIDLIVEDKLFDLSQKAALESFGCKVYIIPRMNVLNINNYKNTLHSIFKNTKYDIIHSYNITRTGMVFSIAKKHNIVHRIFHAHTNKSSDNLLKKVVFRFFLEHSVSTATKLIANTSLSGDYFFNSKEYEILPNGIDISQFKYSKLDRKTIRDKYEIDGTLVGHVGRFTYAKNHKKILKVFAEYNKINRNSKLMLVGDGDLLNEIEKMCNDLKIEDRIIFTGVTDKVEQYYSAMDIFLLPSVYEGFGNVVIEAQATGLPVLASNTIPKEVKETNLVTFLPINNDDYEWAKKIHEIGLINDRFKYNMIMNQSIFESMNNVKNHEKLYVKLVSN